MILYFLYHNRSGKNKRKYMTTDQFVDFLNKTQRDPRLNEILHPYANEEQAIDIIHQYEPNKINVQKGYLSMEGLLRYREYILNVILMIIS